jgi:hypothetical protein
MKTTDVYNKNDKAHKAFLAAEAKKLGTFSKEELRELSGAMAYHNLKLAEILRAMRTYRDDPWGKYFYAGEC